MNAARIRLSAETTKIFFRDGWLFIEVADAGELRSEVVEESGERLLTVEEVSTQTGFGTGAVRGWIKRGALAAITVGRQYRVRASDLNELIAKNTTPRTNQPKQRGRRRGGIVV